MSPRSSRNRTHRSRRSRRSSHRRSTIAPARVAASVAGFLVLGLVAVAAGPPAMGWLTADPTDGVSTVDPAELVVPDPVVRGLIVDPSGSNGGESAARADLKQLAGSVKSWPGPTPPDDGRPYEGVPGLDLTVRQVAQNSYGAGAEVAHIRIPSVPALPPAPADDTDVEATALYLDDVDEVLAAHVEAKKAAKRAAKRLRSAGLRNENSEVAGALSAMIQVLPPSQTPRAIVVISDVEQAGAAPQLDGDLSGTTVTVFQRCDTGADRCTAARDSFTTVTRKLNGPDPQFLRVETLPANLTSILKGQ